MKFRVPISRDEAFARSNNSQGNTNQALIKTHPANSPSTFCDSLFDIRYSPFARLQLVPSASHGV
jgi:hypothetical protein